MSPTHPFRKDFKSFGNRIWLNAASEGPLPQQSAKALDQAVLWKSLPYQLTNEKFASVPKELKESIGRLLALNPRDIILGNSASYGIHLVANGIKWRSRDEICLMQNDFPTNILPWLALEKQGVKIHQIKPGGYMLTPAEFEKEITPRTRLLCLSQVHTFSGHALDVEGFSRLCARHDIIFVLNISQSAGTRPLDFSSGKIDALVCAGYKWLLGPYGTGFCWIRPELRDALEINLAYWVSGLDERQLHSEEALVYRDLRSARKFDIFGTANFFNFVPFNTSINYILNTGLDVIFKHNQGLIDRFINGLPEGYLLISPRKKKERSNLVFISHRDKDRNKGIYQGLIKEGIYPGFWKGNIRICPHLYNSSAEVDRLLRVLKRQE